MARVTIKRVNQALKDAGFTAELVRGVGYFYFVGGGAEQFHQAGVYVSSLQQLTVDEWVKEFKQKAGAV